MFEQEYANAYQMINQQAQQNNEWSAKQAELNRNFQLDMANTAHQREVADLKAAGLNPILSAHGNGAAVGSGAMPSVDTNNTAALTSLLKDLIESNTAIGVANAKAAGGGFSYGTGTTGNKKPNEEDKKEDDVPKGTYSFDMKGLQNFLGDVFHAITGMTAREAVDATTKFTKTQIENFPKYAKYMKNYDPTKPAVTTTKGNTEYGAKPHGTVLQWIMNPISNAAKELRRKRG